MALSMLNFFLWELEDARIPFLLADCVLIGTLRYVERGMKEEMEAREMQQKQQNNQNNELHKSTLLALKQAQREEQKRARQRMLTGGNGSLKTTAHPIQQPNKKK